MGAAVTANLAETKPYGSSVKADVAVTFPSGRMVNVTGWCPDEEAGKGFPKNSLVCMEGNASLREFNDEVDLQLNKATLRRAKKYSGPPIHVAATGKLVHAERGKAGGKDCFRVQIEIKTSARRDEEDPKFDPNKKSTHFYTKYIPLYAKAVGDAVEQIEALIEAEAGRVTLVGYLPSVEPMYSEGLDDPSMQMVCTQVTATEVASADEFWTSTLKAPEATTLPKIAFDDPLPF